MPPTLIIFGAVIVALMVSGIVRSCEEQPTIENGVEILKGGVER